MDKKDKQNSKKTNKTESPVIEDEQITEEASTAEDETSEMLSSTKDSPWGEGGPEAEIADLKDKLLRALADNENTIRRAKREREDTAKYAAANFARDMLTVADNLNRAIAAIPKSLHSDDDEITGFLEGINLTSRELLTVLERHGIERISPLGEKFNHDQHEALFEVPTADKESGIVVQVVEDGFMIHERLLRPAKVGVSKADPPANQKESELDN